MQRPDKYLGADVGKFTLPDGTIAWYTSPDSYVKESIKNVKRWLEKKNEGRSQKLQLKTKAAGALPSGYKPELDVTAELGPEESSWYQQQIGVLRWMVELGRIDVATEVSMLAAHTALPREGHLLAVLHLYAYLSKHNRSKTVYDPTVIEHDEPEQQSWFDAYRWSMVPPRSQVPQRPEARLST